MRQSVMFPVVDLEAALRIVADRVRADADVPELASVDLVIDRSFGSGRTGPGTPTAHDVVAVVGGRRFAAGLEHGLEAACAAVMSGVQDDVIDALGRPWPEVAGPARPIGVLDVGYEPTGVAHWRLRDHPVCPVGVLRATCAAFGWRIR